MGIGGCADQAAAVNCQCPAGGASHPNPAATLLGPCCDPALAAICSFALVAIDLRWLRSPLTKTIHHSLCLQAHRSTVVVLPSPLLQKARIIGAGQLGAGSRVSCATALHGNSELGVRPSPRAERGRAQQMATCFGASRQVWEQALTQEVIWFRSRIGPHTSWSLHFTRSRQAGCRCGLV